MSILQGTTGTTGQISGIAALAAAAAATQKITTGGATPTITTVAQSVPGVKVVTPTIVSPSTIKVSPVTTRTGEICAL